MKKYKNVRMVATGKDDWSVLNWVSSSFETVSFEENSKTQI